MGTKAIDNSKMIWKMLLYFSIALVIGALCAGNLGNLIPGFVTIITRPSQFTMDYFVLGGLGSAFLNAGLVGLACCGLLYFSKANCTGLTIAAFWLNVGFATFGMNFFNIWPFFFGTWIYSKIKKVPFGSVANLAMFATALAPFASELTFRYPNLETSGFSVPGFAATIVLGIVVGCVMPSLCTHAPNLHKGFNLYSAGPVAGLLAFFIYCILYKSPGIEVPTNTNLGDGEHLFVTVFFLIVFSLCFVFAYKLDKDCFKKYKELLKSSGHKTDFTATYGMGATIVNMAVYGLFILLYYNLVHGMTYVEGEVVFTAAKFTGATMGSIMCMYAFVGQGTHPKNVFPIIIGYAVASFLPFFVQMAGITEVQSWSLTTQGILVGLCFASGLAPIAGKYGFWPGVFAGAMHAIMVTSVPLFHGGFCLYNGGFTDGIVAILLIPVLECFMKEKQTA